MLTPPDPMRQKEFKDFVYMSINSFHIHIDDKISGRCHKHPRGIKQCAHTKSSSIVDKTKPVQLLHLTMPQTMPSENITNTYDAKENIQNCQSAINSLPITQQVHPLFCKNDPRLIVYEPKHPMIKA